MPPGGAREGKAQDGDITDIDFEGFVDGVTFDGGKGEHFSLTLGLRPVHSSF